jgi:hypothetical protein
LKRRIARYSGVFANSKTAPGKVRNVSVKIPIRKDAQPRIAKQIPLNPDQRKLVEDMVDGLLADGVIEPSVNPPSEWGHRIVLARKPNGDYRPALDLRLLNEQCVGNAYPGPNTQTVLNHLSGSHWMSVVDSQAAYHSLELDPESKTLTAFQSPKGLFQFLRVPQGYKSGGQEYCESLHRILGELHWTIACTFVDDIIIKTASTSFRQHVEDVSAVLKRMEEAGCRLKARKCSFGLKEANFVGLIIGRDGHCPDPKRAKALTDMPMPTTPNQLHRQHCMLGYWRRYIKGFAKTSAPIRAAISLKRWKDRAIPNDAKAALLQLRKSVTREGGAFLWHPDFTDNAGPWRIVTDASISGLGAHLEQKTDGSWKTVQVASRFLNKAEQRYSVHKLEALAIAWAVKLFRQFVWDKPFEVLTDNAACRYLKSASKGQLARWAMQLSEYNMNIRWIEGSSNVVADSLSRDPVNAAAASRLIPEGKEITLEEVKTEQRKTGSWVREIARKLDNGDEVEEYLSREGVVCTTKRRGGKERKEVEKTLERVALPKSLVRRVLEQQHSLPMAGHRGVVKTMRAVGSIFTWPGMKRDIKNMIRGCLGCKRRKSPVQKAGMAQPMLVADRPCQAWAIDLQTNLPKDAEGNTILLTCVDVFSRWAIAVPLKSRKTSEIAPALYRAIVLQNGIPERLICDNEGAFTSKEMKLLTKSLGIEVNASAAYSPWCQGHVERWHSWLNSSLSILCNRFKDDWREHLDEVILAYRISGHSSMDGLSPFEVHHGRRCRLPSDLISGLASCKQGETVAAYHSRQSDALERAFDWVRKAQLESAAKNKERADSSSKQVFFQKGDQVIVWRPEQRLTAEERKEHCAVPSKYQYRWSRPRTIVRRIHDNTYLVRDNGARGTKTKDRKVHVRHLLRYDPWEDDEEPNSVSKPAKRQKKKEESVTIDSESDEEDNARVEVGDMILVKHNGDEEPFIAGRVSAIAGDDSDITTEDREIVFQLFGSYSGSLRGEIRPGWIDKKNVHYFSNRKQHTSHVPYTNATRGLTVRDSNVDQWGFALKKHKMPNFVLKEMI